MARPIPPERLAVITMAREAINLLEAAVTSAEHDKPRDEVTGYLNRAVNATEEAITRAAKVEA